MKQQSITTLPPSPEAERRSRMIKYTIAMTIRVLCIFAMLFAKGWWLAVFAAGAIFLPYVAVVLANVSGPSRDSEVLRPGGLVPTTPPADLPGSQGEYADVPPTGPEPRSDSGTDGAGAGHGVGNADARHPDAEPEAPPHDERGAA
jgi:hypothetical protein